MKAIRLFKKAETPRVVGRLVRVDLPVFGIENIVAKVDTGAFSGALHATRVREVTDEQGAKHLYFSPLGRDQQVLSADNFHKKRVKSSNGLTSTRYAIDTQVQIFGDVYPITITLTNRASMKYPMIIGRRFFKVNGFLIDVSHGKQ